MCVCVCIYIYIFFCFYYFILRIRERDKQNHAIHSKWLNFSSLNWFEFRLTKTIWNPGHFYSLFISIIIVFVNTKSLSSSSCQFYVIAFKTKNTYISKKRKEIFARCFSLSIFFVFTHLLLLFFFFF